MERLDADVAERHRGGEAVAADASRTEQLIHRVTVTGGDKQLDQTLAELWRFENQKCVELWARVSNQEAWDAFWR